jgi:hypothetical protein
VGIRAEPKPFFCPITFPVIVNGADHGFIVIRAAKEPSIVFDPAPGHPNQRSIAHDN